MAARIVGTLLWELAADMAKLRVGMDDAVKQVNSAMKSIDGAIDIGKKAFGALAAAAGIASFGSFVKSAIDAADRLAEMSERTGVAASELSRLELAFKLGGVSSEGMQQSLVKLSVTMNTNSDAIEQLGVKTKNTDGTLRGSSEVLRDLADKFQKMDNGARKTALAVEIFGKSGADIIPVLNMGSDGIAEMTRLSERLGIALDDEATSAANQFNDTLDILKMSVNGVARGAIAELMPSLNSMASAMLQAASETDVLKNISDGLGFVLKTLFSVVVALQGAISVLITILQTSYRAFWDMSMLIEVSVVETFTKLKAAVFAMGDSIYKLATGDFKGAAESIKAAGAEITTGWDKTSAQFDKTSSNISSGMSSAAKSASDANKVISSAFANSADSAITETAKILAEAKRNQSANVQTAESYKEAEAAAKKTAAEYQKIAESLDKATLAAKAETDAGGKLTDSQKLALDVRAKLNDTTLKLTDAQRKEIESKLAAAQAALDDRDAQRAADAARKALSDSIVKQNDDLVRQIEAQKRANQEAGLSTDELQRLEIQRLRDAAATAEQNAQLRIQSGINDEIAAEYQRQAELLRKLADEKEAGIHIKAAREAADAWAKTTQSIYDGLTDALMRAFESGKGFMQAFVSVIRNTFKTMVLEPTVRAIVAPVAGAIGGAISGVAGAATGAAGAATGGFLGSIGAGIAASGLLGTGFMHGLAHLGAGQIGAGLSAGGYMISAGIAGGSLGSITAGLGAIVGTLGPIALGIAVLVKAFGRGPKQTTGTGIQGSIGFGDTTAQQFTDWVKKGGWFRSDKRGTDLATLSAEVEQSLDRTAAAVFSQANQFADVLGLSNESLKRVLVNFRVTLTDSEEENEKALAAVFEQYRQELAGSFAHLLSPFRAAGETLADTYARLAVIQTFARSINEFGGIFSRIANASVAAQEELFSFAGGIEAFVRKTQSFVQNFYSQEEQIGLQARSIAQDLQKLGITQDISTRQQFRALVESQDISTTRGRETFNALLDIAQRFASISGFLEENKRSLAEAARAAPTTETLKNILDASRAEGAQATTEFYQWYRENWGGYVEDFDAQAYASEQFYAAYIKDAELRAKLDKDSAETLKKILEQEQTNDQYKAEFDDRLFAETQKLRERTDFMSWHTQTNMIGLNEQAHYARQEYLALERDAQTKDSLYYRDDLINSQYVNQFNDRLYNMEQSSFTAQNDRLTAINDQLWWANHNSNRDTAIIINGLSTLNATTQNGLAAVATNTNRTASLLDRWDDGDGMTVVVA